MAASVSGQPNKTANSNQQPGHPEQPVTAKSTPEKQNGTADDKGKADSDPPKWYAPLERPDWWLVILGFGTLLVVGWQTKILGDSVAVAKNSAETTGKQVELYANAERARITIDITDSGRSFRIRGKILERQLHKFNGQTVTPSFLPMASLFRQFLHISLNQTPSEILSNPFRQTNSLRPWIGKAMILWPILVILISAPPSETSRKCFGLMGGLSTWMESRLDAEKLASATRPRLMQGWRRTSI